MADNELLQLIYSGMQGLQKDVHEIKVDIADLKDRVTAVEKRLDTLEARFDTLEARFDVLETDVKELNKRVRSIETTLENETNRNIKIIAESHLDLSRKLTEAVKVSDAEKAYQVKVNFLESDMRKVKEILNIA